MSTRLFDSDPLMRADILWHTDTDGSVTVEHRQDITDLVERNKREYASWDARSRWGVGRKVAEISMVALLDLQRRGIARDPTLLLKWLESEEGRPYLTSPGRLV